MSHLTTLVSAAMVFVAILTTPMATSAATIDPTYTYFGSLSQATFGGTGIPNNAVAVTEVTSGNYDIILGLTAHGRYSNPPVQSDGAGNFYAVSGNDSPSTTYGRWNIGYYIDFNLDLSDFSPAGYSVRLYYDKDLAANSDVTSYIQLEPNILNGLSFDSQNSWNLGMTSVFPAGAFYPNYDGEYDFALVVLKDGGEIGRSAITVHVNQTGTPPVPDAGSTAALLGGGIALLGFAARPHRK